MASAMVISKLVRGYGSGRSRVDVLQSLGMSVEEGTIYGLLGPSGCGKTTLLKVVLGRLVPEAGDVDVLGSRPGETGSAVPGSAAGYATQVIALYEDLPSAETLSSHRLLHGLSKSRTSARQDSPDGSLHLPAPR